MYSPLTHTHTHTYAACTLHSPTHTLTHTLTHTHAPMMHVQDPILGHNDNFRRTWDKATYEKLAKERLQRETKGEGTGLTKRLDMRLGFGNETYVWE